MGLFGKKAQKVMIGNAFKIDRDTIVFPSDQVLFPALFREGGPRSFHRRYAIAVASAEGRGLFDFPEDVTKKIEECRGRKVTESELYACLAPYRDRVHQLWVSLEEKLKAEIEQGTIDSFPKHFHTFATFRWGKELHNVRFCYFNELDRALGRDIPEWPWFSVCEPIWMCYEPKKNEVLKVLQQAYPLLRYYTLWNSTLPVPFDEVRDMQWKFRRALQTLGVKKEDSAFLFEVPELPKDLMEEAEPAMPHYPVEKTPPEQFASLQEGDILRFGSYPYEKDGSQRTIEWEVTYAMPDTGWVNVTSCLCLDVIPFCHERRDDVTWENSDLRRWLNEDFYRTAFTEEERRYIAMRENHYGTDWNAMKALYTKDHICVPEESVIEHFSKEMTSAGAGLTPYAFSKMKELKLLRYISPYTYKCSWWLRATHNNGQADTVTCGGGTTSELVDRNQAVRVMFKLKFDSDSEL
ncbi:MAG: DUF6273 domain-containing protein [Christensenellales bacterium]